MSNKLRFYLRCICLSEVRFQKQKKTVKNSTCAIFTFQYAMIYSFEFAVFCAPSSHVCTYNTQFIFLFSCLRLQCKPEGYFTVGRMQLTPVFHFLFYPEGLSCEISATTVECWWYNCPPHTIIWRESPIFLYGTLDELVLRETGEEGSV